MLPVHRGDELAAVDLLGRQQRDLDIGEEDVTGSWRERARLYRVDGAADDRVDLDLHHEVVALDEELRLADVGRGRSPHLECALAQAGAGFP